MQTFITTLLCLALSALALAAGSSTLTSYDADTYIYHGYSTAEVWVGRSAINVGDLIGEHMFTRMLTELSKACGPKVLWCQDNQNHQTDAHYVRNIDTGEIGWTYFGFTVNGKWESENHRLLLVNAVAKTMQSLTDTNFSENCYNVPGHGKFCNVGDFVRVNLPASPGKQNHLWVNLTGDKVHGEFKCCPTRYKVDGALDSMGDEFKIIYQQPFSRTVWCLIDHQLTCGECGQKCDACGRSCPNVCPGGRC